MRIALDGRSLTDLRLTGVGISTERLITHLAKAFPQDTFLVFVSGSKSTRDRVPPFPFPNVTVFGTSIPNRLLSLLLILPFAPLSLDAFLPYEVDLWLFPNHNALQTRRPYLFTVHDLSFLHFPHFFSRKDRLALSLQGIPRLIKDARHILVPSRSTAQDVTTRFPSSRTKVTVVPLGVDHTRFLPREQPSDRTFRAPYDLNRPYILSAATLEPRKNLESVIEGYDAFRSRGGEPLPLVIMGGDGYHHKRIKRLAQEAMFGNDIRLLGYVPEKHKPALMRGASVFIFPSYYEGFGLPVLEAMASGVPVITSFASSLPEIAHDAAIFIDPFNVEDVTQALLAVFHQTEGHALQEMLRKKGIARAKQFQWEETAKKTMAAIKEMQQSLSLPQTDRPEAQW